MEHKMLSYLVCVLLVGVSVAVTYHRPAVGTRVNCFKYYDATATLKLSGNTQGYPESHIREELVRRPHMRVVLYDPATIVPRPQPVHPTGGGYPAIARRYKRSYVSYSQRYPGRSIYRKFPFFQKPAIKPVRQIQPKPAIKPIRQFQPNPAIKRIRPILTKPVIPKPQRPSVARPIGEVCPSQKYVLRKFWMYGGDCYVINPQYQNVAYSKCSKRVCSNCAYTAWHTYHQNPVNRCVETRETVQMWAFCNNLAPYSRIKRVALSLPKYCTCKTYKC